MVATRTHRKSRHPLASSMIVFTMIPRTSSSEHIVVSSPRPAAGLVVTVDRQDYIPS
uniref:Uncharacterized protein n=1 Tax=Timema genevievae TaxID=629358 RepID=A0A7R9JWF7_TIMGE|nr:unnamed protein product [Timema genevievae]